MEKIRCSWCEKDDLYRKYHDEEWGKPVYDDETIFEFLVLESFQAGLSWYTILNKRENFRKAFDNAVDLCVFICREYGLTEKNIISHQEGNRIGIASNHGDVGHWFPKHGEDMDSFRKVVREKLQVDDELEVAVKLMVEKEIINSPHYWLDNARKGKTVNGEYAAILIKRVAGLLNQ